MKPSPGKLEELRWGKVEKNGFWAKKRLFLGKLKF